MVKNNKMVNILEVGAKNAYAANFEAVIFFINHIETSQVEFNYFFDGILN